MQTIIFAFLIGLADGHCTASSDTCYNDGRKQRVLPWPDVAPFHDAALTRG
eukprot:gene13450-19880_t